MLHQFEEGVAFVNGLVDELFEYVNQATYVVRAFKVFANASDFSVVFAQGGNQPVQYCGSLFEISGKRIGSASTRNLHL